MSFVLWTVGECSFWFCGAGTALVQMFHKDIKGEIPCSLQSVSSGYPFTGRNTWAWFVPLRLLTALHLVYLHNVVGFCFSFFFLCDCLSEHY